MHLDRSGMGAPHLSLTAQGPGPVMHMNITTTTTTTTTTNTTNNAAAAASSPAGDTYSNSAVRGLFR